MNNIDTNTLAIIATIITITPIIIIILKIIMIIKYFQIAKNTKELNNKQETILRTLLEIKRNQKDYDHKDV